MKEQIVAILNAKKQVYDNIHLLDEWAAKNPANRETHIQIQSATETLIHQVSLLIQWAQTTTTTEQ
jgi:hypothetical protein